MVQKEHSLRGRTVVVTRPRHQAEGTLKEIEVRGGKPYLFSTIEIRGPVDLDEVRDFFDSLRENRVDYVVLMSVNGVRHLLNAAEKLGMKYEVVANLQTPIKVAVGPKTADEMKKNGISVDLVPEEYTSESILECLQNREIKSKTIFIPRTKKAPPELAEKLREMGSNVKEVYVYESELPSNKELSYKLIEDSRNGKIDAILFSSSLGVINFFKMLDPNIPREQLKKIINERITVVAIGPTTAKTIAEFGITVDVMPQKALVNEALDALVAYWYSEELSS